MSTMNSLNLNEKKICLVVTSLRSGGLEKNASILANHFAKQGHDVSICCLYSASSFFNLDKRIKLVDLSTKRNKFLSLYIWKRRINSYLSQNHIDTVISFSEQCGVLVSLSIKNANVNHICRGVNTRRNLIYKFLMELNKSRINKFVCQTQAQKESLPMSLQKKSLIIHNPFENKKNNLNIEGNHSKRFITIASFKLKQKKQDEMIKAFALFLKTHPGYTFEFYGRYENKAYKKISRLIRKLNISDSVKLKGESTKLNESILPCRGFICSSTYEGMPNALIESLSLGIPVISTKWKGFEDVLEDNKNCLLYESKNIKQLSEKMSLLANDDSLFELLSNCSCNFKVTSEESVEIFKKWDQII